MIVLAAMLADAPAKIVVGMGDTTCAVAMVPERRFRAFDYVWGVWTGLNIAANKPVGHTTDAHGILKEVVLACMEYPQAHLSDAVLGVHMRFERTGQ